MKKQLEEGVENLRATLLAKRDLANSGLELLRPSHRHTNSTAITHGRDMQEYVDAKRTIDEEQKKLIELKRKQTKLSASLAVSR